ncbi:hypothetical protein GCM10011611_41780 [Aliidongia dinghuensis]|uniref:Uncharacterized protein n=1 Tax=Aliidongia dinghuensis TaxID=1867774 RepID=A0A8J2YWB4_9PROT|nr:hypothetical protein [Aliidongia dinghuensis]GGF31276.1 hypothetical protein GCM10011611_41780 [Aliidongia dinghuensis]
MTRLLTLGQCAERGLQIEVLCTGCLRRKTVSAGTLLAKFGPDIVPPNLNGRLKCAVCSSNRCQVRALAP